MTEGFARDADPEERDTPFLAALLDFLEDVGTEQTEHTHGPLRAHLRGTHDLLARWGCSEELRLAGLFHSIYGTEMFSKTTIPLDERSRVAERIGEDAERLVYLYALLRRSSLHANLERGAPYEIALVDGTVVPLSVDELAALVTLDVANRLEQTHDTLDDQQRVTYARTFALLPRGGVIELRAALARRPPTGLRVRARLRRIPGLRRARESLRTRISR